MHIFSLTFFKAFYYKVKYVQKELLKISFLSQWIKRNLIWIKNLFKLCSFIRDIKRKFWTFIKPIFMWALMWNKRMNNLKIFFLVQKNNLFVAYIIKFIFLEKIFITFKELFFMSYILYNFKGFPLYHNIHMMETIYKLILTSIFSILKKTTNVHFKMLQ